MSEDCCSQNSAETNEAQAAGKAVCPQCGHTGIAVPGQTIKALLSVSLRRIAVNDFYFCRTPTCQTVYFSVGAESFFSKSDLREWVYQKEPGRDDMLVCYCFRHTAGDIRNGSPASREAILNDIKAGIRDNQCACDLRNPQGSCCLGNIYALIKEAEKKE